MLHICAAAADVFHDSSSCGTKQIMSHGVTAAECGVAIFGCGVETGTDFGNKCFTRPEYRYCSNFCLTSSASAAFLILHCALHHSTVDIGVGRSVLVILTSYSCTLKLWKNAGSSFGGSVTVVNTIWHPNSAHPRQLQHPHTPVVDGIQLCTLQ